MKNIRCRLRPLLQGRAAVPEDGATAVEYGLLVALIAAVIIGVVATLGTSVLAAFNSMIGTF